MRTDIKVAGAFGFAVITFLGLVAGIIYAERFEARFGIPLIGFLALTASFCLLFVVGLIIMTSIE